MGVSFGRDIETPHADKFSLTRKLQFRLVSIGGGLHLGCTIVDYIKKTAFFIGRLSGLLISRICKILKTQNLFLTYNRDIRSLLSSENEILIAKNGVIINVVVSIGLVIADTVTWIDHTDSVKTTPVNNNEREKSGTRL